MGGLGEGAVGGGSRQGGRGEPPGGGSATQGRGGSSHPGFPERGCTRPQWQTAPSQPPFPCDQVPTPSSCLLLLLDPQMLLLGRRWARGTFVRGHRGPLVFLSCSPGLLGSGPPSHPSDPALPSVAAPPSDSSGTGTCAAAANPSAARAAFASAPCSPRASDATRTPSSSSMSVGVWESETQKFPAALVGARGAAPTETAWGRGGAGEGAPAIRRRSMRAPGTSGPGSPAASPVPDDPAPSWPSLGPPASPSCGCRSARVLTCCRGGRGASCWEPSAGAAGDGCTLAMGTTLRGLGLAWSACPAPPPRAGWVATPCPGACAACPGRGVGVVRSGRRFRRH